VSHDFLGKHHCDQCRQRYEQGLAAYFKDEQEIRASHWNPSVGQVVVDVGCAEGSYTLPALICRGPVGRKPSSRYTRAPALEECARSAGVDLKLLTTVNQALFNGEEYPADLFDYTLSASPDSRFSTLDKLVSRYRLKPAGLGQG
jgi:hypothetical protein